jgi:MFS family permease
MLVDKLGPKILFSAILMLGGLVSIAFSWMQSYEQLALFRFLSGFIGAGFVVGIRMISEWFPAKQTVKSLPYWWVTISMLVMIKQDIEGYSLQYRALNLNNYLPP